MPPMRDSITFAVRGQGVDLFCRNLLEGDFVLLWGILVFHAGKDLGNPVYIDGNVFDAVDNPIGGNVGQNDVAVLAHNPQRSASWTR